MGLGQGTVGQSGWGLSLYPAAAEAGGSFRYSKPPKPGTGIGDPERAKAEAARRARAEVRRYCAANRLNRLGTLTYRGQGCHDPRQLRDDLAQFFRGLRSGRGGKALPYLWVPEWHKTDHGLHAHFAVGEYVARGLIESAWGRGFVHIKLIGDLAVGSGALEESRKAAGYLSKYVGKTFDHRREPGLHRYEVAEGFQPRSVKLWGRTADEAIDRAAEHMGAEPAHLWRSAEVEGWRGPPAVWAAWAG